MDKRTRKFIEYLPMPHYVSVRSAAEMLGGKHWVDILLYEIHDGPLMSFTHSSVKGNPVTKYYRSGEVEELPCISLDANPSHVFISGDEVLWRWCMEYERGAQGVNLPERHTVEARQQAVLKLSRERLSQAAPTEVGANEIPASDKKWTPERLAELKAYREKHGTEEAARKYGISAARVRALLPSDKPQPKGYGAFTHRPK